MHFLLHQERQWKIQNQHLHLEPIHFQILEDFHLRLKILILKLLFPQRQKKLQREIRYFDCILQLAINYH